jgi:hypothetical protein
MGKTKPAPRRSGGEDRPSRKDMSIILRSVPPGYHWGWFSREDQRMHLQTVDAKHFNQYKVWLEHKGKRVIEPVGDMPAKVQKAIEAETFRMRAHIDGRWVMFMMRNNWIELHVALPEVAITAYPHSPNKFTRKVNLQEWFSDTEYARIKPGDVFLNDEMASLAVFKDRPEDLRHDFNLARILWGG